MSYAMNWEASGVYVVFADPVDMGQVESATSDMYNHPRFEEIQYFIWNVKQIKALDMTPDDTEAMAYTDHVASSYKLHLKGAFIAEIPETCDVVLRYIELSRAIGNPWEHRLFGNESQAREWVGVSPMLTVD